MWRERSASATPHPRSPLRKRASVAQREKRERISSSTNPQETCYRKPCRDRRPRNSGPPGLHRRRQPHAVHPRARAAGPVHAGRSRRRLRPAAAAAPAVRARRVRPGHPRLRQRPRRRDEPGAHRRAADGHGRRDAGVHGADQLRLRHAVDRHRVSVHPRGPRRPHPRRRRRGAEPVAADLSQERGRVVCAARRRARPLVPHRRACGLSSLVPQAGHRARARADGSGGRAQHGPDRGNSRASLSYLAPSGRRIRGREPVAARARAEGTMVRRRARARLRPQRQGLRLRRRRAAGHHGRDAGQAQAGVRAAVGQGDGGQQLADHRRRLVGHSRVGARRSSSTG